MPKKFEMLEQFLSEDFHPFHLVIIQLVRITYYQLVDVHVIAVVYRSKLSYEGSTSSSTPKVHLGKLQKL
jgi:hypothetical protein